MEEVIKLLNKFFYYFLEIIKNMSETLEKIRKVLLGMQLYDKCAQNGVSNEELEERLAMLQNRNCLTNCDLQDLVNVCQLNTEPRRGCATSIDLETAKDEPCHEYFEQQEEDCAICYEPLDEGEAEYAGKCGHLFHKACLRGYLSTLQERNYKCPACRGDVFRKFFRREQVRANEQQEVINLEDDEKMISENPLVTTRLITVRFGEDDEPEEDKYVIYFGRHRHYVTEISENMIDNFRERILPMLNEKAIDVFSRESNRLIREINRVFNETDIQAEDAELDIERLTEERIREVLQESDTIQPTTTAQQININATLYDFIRKYIVVGIGEDEDLVQYFEEYFLLLQDYQNADTFISAVLLLVPAFIKELKEEQGYSEYEIELNEDEEEYSD